MTLFGALVLAAMGFAFGLLVGFAWGGERALQHLRRR
jgi:hypothetical protein